MDEFTYDRLLRCLNSPNLQIQKLTIILINNLLQENITQVVESKKLDDIISWMVSHLKKQIELFNESPAHEESYEDLFEVVKVFQIIGLSKESEHKKLVTIPEVLDLIHQLFDQNKSDHVLV